MHPWRKENESFRGWSAIMELHNGNFHPLLWWYGRLFHLRDAPKELAARHYSRYRGKTSRSSSWTLLKKYLGCEIQRLDKEYRNARAKENRKAAKECPKKRRAPLTRQPQTER
ncbi:MAG: hypothetical protein HY917_02370 [Candidatus Diapherotrites archaeon]|nr:hypothetical protein [Candidatus Diapherotrites archaeon]